MSQRKHGSQLIDEEDWGDDAKMTVAKEAMNTELVEECYRALIVIADKRGLEACDPDAGTDRCDFPRCLIMGCEAEPKEGGE